jgi:hypothetical protein
MLWMMANSVNPGHGDAQVGLMAMTFGRAKTGHQKNISA